MFLTISVHTYISEGQYIVSSQNTIECQQTEKKNRKYKATAYEKKLFNCNHKRRATVEYDLLPPNMLRVANELVNNTIEVVNSALNHKGG